MSAHTNVIIGAKFGTNELGDVSALLDGTNVLSSVAYDNAQPVVQYDSATGLGFVAMGLDIDLAPSEIILRPITGYSHMTVFRIATPRLFLVEEGTTWSSEHGYLTIVDFHDELLALPPSTMQMLPTNQFYNVED